MRQPFQVTVAQQVGAAVPDVRETEIGAVEHGAGDRRAHTLQGKVGFNQFRDLVVGLVDGRASTSSMSSPVVGLSIFAIVSIATAEKRSPAAAPPMPSATTSRCGLACRSPGCSSGSGRSRSGRHSSAGGSSDHGSSLNMVLPMRTVSASVIVVGAVIRWPFT